MKIICPQCQAANESDNQFCAQCGVKLVSDLESTISFTISTETGEDEHFDLGKLSLEGPLLLVIKGLGVGKVFLITSGEEVLIGRDPENDIFLDDVTVSRKHARIGREEGKLAIVDTDSLNGTYLNKQRVDEAYLNNGDELQIGKFRMIFLDKPGAVDGK